MSSKLPIDAIFGVAIHDAEATTYVVDMDDSEFAYSAQAPFLPMLRDYLKSFPTNDIRPTITSWREYLDLQKLAPNVKAAANNAFSKIVMGYKPQDKNILGDYLAIHNKKALANRGLAKLNTNMAEGIQELETAGLLSTRTIDNLKSALAKKEAAAAMAIESANENLLPNTIEGLYTNIKPEYSYDLSDAPPNFLALCSMFQHMNGGKSTMSVGYALFLASAICGKQLRIDVQNRKYKTQLRLASIDRSGSGKSPILEYQYQSTKHLLNSIELLNSCTMTSFFKNRGVALQRAKDGGGPTMAQLKQDVVNKALADTTVNAIIVDDGESFFGSMTNWQAPFGKTWLSDYCALIDDGLLASYETGKDGVMCLGDPCVPLLVNITTKAWHEFSTNANVQSSGAAFRHLPINGVQLEFKLPEVKPRSLATMLNNLTNMQPVIVTDLSYDDQAEGWERKAQEAVCSRNKLLQELIANYPDTAKIMLPKMAIVAKKIAAIWWALENHETIAADFAEPPVPETRQYYEKAFELVTVCYTTDGKWHPPTDTDTEDMKRIVRYLDKNKDQPAKCRKGNITQCVRVITPANDPSKAKRVGFLLRELMTDGRIIEKDTTKGKYYAVN
jgi:hypothetical protein